VTPFVLKRANNMRRQLPQRARLSFISPEAALFCEL
jgi:hypothetical protein